MARFICTRNITPSASVIFRFQIFPPSVVYPALLRTSLKKETENYPGFKRRFYKMPLVVLCVRERISVYSLLHGNEKNSLPIQLIIRRSMDAQLIMHITILFWHMLEAAQLPVSPQKLFCGLWRACVIKVVKGQFSQHPLNQVSHVQKPSVDCSSCG